MADHGIDVGFEIALIASLGGILPAIFWLWFWLKEDQARPEPKSLIIKTFILGGLLVIPTYLAQRFWRDTFGLNLTTDLLIITLGWAAIEEVTKYLAARAGGLNSRYFDEPVDAMIYLITAALGFAAAENSLYLLNNLSLGGRGGLDFLILGNFRFIGATVLHIVTSSILGFSLALSFCAKPAVRRLSFGLGLITATLLHAIFNYFIITSAEGTVSKIFFILWAAAVLVIFFFERVKNLVYRVKLE